MNGWPWLLCLWLASLALWCSTAEAATTRPTLNFEPNLPLVFLQVTNGLEKETKVPCRFELVDPAKPAAAAIGPLSSGVNLHGRLSLGFPKKSLSLSLETPVALLGMRTNSHWVLNAAYIDRSLMRHKLSYDLFRSLATRQVPHPAADSRFVEVFQNDEYKGVYLLMERVDRRLFEFRSYHSNDLQHACIYKAIDHAACFDSPGHSGYEQREPEPALQTYWGPLDDFNRYVTTAPNDKVLDPRTGLPARLDLDNAMDFHLLVLLSSNGDGITKNFFFGRNACATNEAPPRFLFAPWDYDGSFGRNWDGHAYPFDVWLSNYLFDRLLSNRDYRTKCAARWRELRAREFSVNKIISTIDDHVRTLGPAAQRNAARWPARPTFESDVAYMKTWVANRVQWLDQRFERMAAAN